MDTGSQLEGSPVSKEDLLNKHTQFLSTIRHSKVSNICNVCVSECTYAVHIHAYCTIYVWSVQYILNEGYSRNYVLL